MQNLQPLFGDWNVSNSMEKSKRGDPQKRRRQGPGGGQVIPTYMSAEQFGKAPGEACNKQTARAPNQYGFRLQRSTEDALNCVVEMTHRSKDRYVMAVFVDIAGAFDNLWWPALFRELREMGCPSNVYNLKELL